MHEVLLHNDQLAWNMARGLVLQNFTGTFVLRVNIFLILELCSLTTFLLQKSYHVNYQYQYLMLCAIA